jgi:hypothetical protein
MNSRDFDPLSLDVAAFAKAGGALDGFWPLTNFDRLVETATADARTRSVRHVPGKPRSGCT